MPKKKKQEPAPPKPPAKRVKAAKASGDACGAQLKGKPGKFCRNAAMPNGRCRMHGGKSPKGIASPNFKHGKRSKYTWLPDPLKTRASELEFQLLDNIDQNIRLLATLETTYLEKLGTTESTAAWQKLGEAVSAYKSAEFLPKPEEKAQARAKAFGMIRFVVEEGLSQSFLHGDIQRIQESQRKQTETLHKCRKADERAITEEHLVSFARLMLIIIRNRVTDRSTLSLIQQDVQDAAVEVGVEHVM